jgi:hypothetical protein
VQLIIYYIIFMVGCDLAAYLIGLITEVEFGGHIQLSRQVRRGEFIARRPNPTPAAVHFGHPSG